MRATTEEVKAGKGKAPGRVKPRRAGMAADRRNAEPSSQRDKGRKPLKLGRAGLMVRSWRRSPTDRR